MRADGRMARELERRAEARDCDHAVTYEQHRTCTLRWGSHSEKEAWLRREGNLMMISTAVTAGLTARVTAAELEARAMAGNRRRYHDAAGGVPEPIPPRARARKKLAHERQVDSADFLADRGLAIEHNATPRPNGKMPDYRIGGPRGRLWDHYNPTAASVEQVRKGIGKKVAEEQARRIVLRLDDTPVTGDEVVRLLRRKPKEGLEDLIIIEAGQYRRFEPGAPALLSPPGG